MIVESNSHSLDQHSRKMIAKGPKVGPRPSQDNSLVVAPIQELELAPLRYNSRIHKPLERYINENQKWDTVPCPPSDKPLGNKFVFSIKLRSNESIYHYKSRLVVLGNKQKYGLYYDETFTPVAKMTTVYTLLALVASILLVGLTNSTFVDTPLEVNVKYRQEEGDILDDLTISQASW
ncbi:hypothetical protein CR513_23193, partial [Mucuna pruriens]